MAEVKTYKVLSLPSSPSANSLYYVKPTNISEISVFITDINGVPYPLKDLQGSGGITTLTNTDGNLVITGVNNKIINIAPALLSLINSALQSGANISELNNDEGFITITDIPTNVSEFTNDAGYLTSFTETDPIFIASEANLFIVGDKSKLDGIEAGAEVNNISDVNAMDLTDGGETTLHNHDSRYYTETETNNLLDSKFNNPVGNDTQYLDGAGVPTTFPIIPSGVTNLAYTASPTNGIVTSDTGTDATIPIVDFTNAGLLSPEEKQLLYNNSSTGITKFGGFSINVDNTKYNAGIIEGWFIDNTINPNTPTKVFKLFPATLGNTITNLATQNVTYIAIDVNGVHQQSGVPFEPELQRDWIPLGVIVHSNRVNINTINNQPVVALSPNNQLSDLMESIGFFNISGNVFSPNGANLSINKSLGQVFKQGVNFINNNKDPHTLLLPALLAPNNIRYRTQLGIETSDTNVVSPNFWDNSGVITAMTGTRWSIQRIYLFQTNLIRIQYGQATYENLAEALQAVPTEAFVVEQNILENGLFRGLLIVRRNAINLTDSSRALFIEASKFGSVAGLGSLSTTSLQQAYNNSVTPEITTDATLGAITIKRGSTLDTDNVFETQNGTGTVTASIDGNGQILGSNLSGINTGDETTSSIQTKRPLKTINGESLEGTGNLVVNPTSTLTESEIDFGTKPLNNKTFTITDGAITNTKKVIVFPSPNDATGQVGNDWEVDGATFSAKANTGNMTLYVNAPFSMNGKRKIYYQILN